MTTFSRDADAFEVRHLHEVLPQVGALIEEPAAYPHLSGRANLTLFDAAGPGGLGWAEAGAGPVRPVSRARYAGRLVNQKRK